MILTKEGKTSEGTVVYTDHQLLGKGQRGNIWLDEPGKNILMSVLLHPHYLTPSEYYLLNLVVSLGVIRCAGRFIDHSKLKLKWPNDVLVEDRKICGILIENTIQEGKIEKTIVGIGFNLNQDDFSDFRATSLFRETNKEFDKEDFIESLLADIEVYVLKLKNGQQTILRKLYHEKLYLRGESKNYKDKSGEFAGTILGIDKLGRLIVNKNGNTYYYAVKEIEFLS